MADINLNIALSIQQATADIKKFSQQAADSLDKVAASSKEVEKQVGAVGKNTSFAMQSLATSVGTVLADAFVSATSSIISFSQALISDSVKSAIEAENAQNQLNTALRISGQYTEENVKALKEQADALSESTKFSDDQITSTQDQIQALARLDSEGLQKATKSALDLAVVFNKDLGDAANIVGKAAEGNTTALQKMGIEVKKGKTDAETFANVLQVLGSRFKDSAETSVKTFGGALALSRNSIDEAKESLGKLITQNPAVVTGIREIGLFAVKLTEVFNENKGAITSLINEGITVLAKSFIFALDIVRFFVEGLDGLKFAINLGISKFIDFNLTLVETFAKSGNAIGKFVGISSDAFDSLVKDLTTLSVESKRVTEEDFQTAVKTASERSKLYDDIRSAAEKASSTTIAATQKQEEVSKQVFQGEKERAQIRAQKNAEETAQIQKALEDKRTLLLKEADDALKQNELLRQIDADANAAKIEQNNALAVANIEEVQKAREAEITSLQEHYDKIAAIEVEKRTAAQAADLVATQQLITQKQLAANQELEITRKKAEAEKAIEDKKLKNVLGASSTFFGNMSTLMQTKNRELFEIGRTAAYATAIVNVAQGITEALKFGPILGPIAAASVAVAGAVQIATISAQKLATGITEVPSGFQNDSFPALLTSGERVLSVDQNKDLKQFISGGNGASDQKLDEINSNLIAAMNRPVIVQVGGREIFRTVQDEISSGRVLVT